MRYCGVSQSLAVRSLGLLAFVALVAAVVIIARCGEHLAWSDVGFGGISWASLVWAVAFACFLVSVFGPLAAVLLARVRVGAFNAGTAVLNALPFWYLIMTIVLVAAGEDGCIGATPHQLESAALSRRTHEAVIAPTSPREHRATCLGGGTTWPRVVLIKSQP
jgi:hypothetical protein